MIEHETLSDSLYNRNAAVPTAACFCRRGLWLPTDCHAGGLKLYGIAIFPAQAVREDLHWADPSTLDLLGSCVQQTPAISMLHVLTARPEFVSPWFTRSHLTPLTLNRLERPQVAVLITRLAGDKAERAGQQVQRIGSGFGYEGESPMLTDPRCASMHGFSLHANTHMFAHRRDQLERLIRYIARGAVSLERLEEEAHGDLISTFTRAWSDGTRGLTFAPLAWVEKLAALMPPPRLHQARDGGCVTPPSTLRGAITPTHANRVARQRHSPSHLAGAGRGCSRASLPSPWRAVPGSTRAPCGAAARAPTDPSSAVS